MWHGYPSFWTGSCRFDLRTRADGRKYLADPNVDVRLAAENVLAEFLREIKYIANVQEKQAEADSRRRKRPAERKESKQTIEEDEVLETEEEESGDEGEDWEGEGSGAWVPGQGVVVDHPAIMDIIIQHLIFAGEFRSGYSADDRRVGAIYRHGVDLDFSGICTKHRSRLHTADRTCHSAKSGFTSVRHHTVEADSSRHIKLAAHETNGSLYRVIQSLSLQIQHPTPSQPVASPNVPITTSPSIVPKKESEMDPLKDPLSTEPDAKAITSSASASNVGSVRTKSSTAVPASEPVTPIQFEFPAGIRSSSPNVQTGTPKSTVAETVSDDDAFDVRETVNVLTLQFLSDHAETRIAALEWLLMLHLKAPQKVSLMAEHSLKLDSITR